MSYTELTLTQTQSGEPTKQELFRLIRSNLADHETRITTVENATTTREPITFELYGGYGDGGGGTGILFFRVTSSISLTGCRLFIVTAGSAGTTEVDILKSAAGGGAFTSIFSTRPSVAFGSGNYAVSSNGVLTSNPILCVAGEILRLDLTAVQTAGDTAIAQLEWEPT